MFSKITIARKFIRYWLTASNGKGHGIHSPFVFKFVTEVLNGRTIHPLFAAIEARRNDCLHNNAAIAIEDFGAGASGKIINQRLVKDIAATSLKPKKYSSLLHRMVHFFQARQLLEMGTSLGITSAYLAAANPRSTLYTLEGSSAIASIAADNFRKLGLNNIVPVTGDFESTLGPVLAEMNGVDFAFVDGNHRRDPTINYFHQLLKHSRENSIIVFDDIHWSAGMEEAWAYITGHAAVTCSIDLFFIGIVFFNKDFKSKEHFVIRF